MPQSVYSIPAMDCPAEEAVIRSRLGKIPEVSTLSFDLFNRRLTVEHTLESDAPIVKALKGIGMTPGPRGAGKTPSAEGEHDPDHGATGHPHDETTNEHASSDLDDHGAAESGPVAVSAEQLLHSSAAAVKGVGCTVSEEQEDRREGRDVLEAVRARNRIGARYRQRDDIPALDRHPQAEPRAGAAVHRPPTPPRRMPKNPLTPCSRPWWLTDAAARFGKRGGKPDERRRPSPFIIAATS